MVVHERQCTPVRTSLSLTVTAVFLYLILLHSPHDLSLPRLGGVAVKRGFPKVDGPRIAICVVGEPRAFDLTGPSIRRHVLAAYNNSDVFFNLALTDNTHKLTTLSSLPNQVALRVFPQVPVNETDASRSVLTDDASPGGFQGLLLYFQMVEGCWDLIQAHQRESGKHYDWVLRIRADSYWNGPPPPLDQLDPLNYTLPIGLNFGGWNDRAGIGGPSSSQVALQRLSSLPRVVDTTHHTNSESEYKTMLAASHVNVSQHDFSFCIYTRRYLTPTLMLPLQKNDVPLLSIRTEGPLNGAYCRACTPDMIGEEALQFYQNFSNPFGSNASPQFCKGSQPPDFEGWGPEFDASAGPEAADIRHDVMNRNFSECVLAFRILETSAGYVGPPAEVACQLAGWGRVEVVGNGWPIYTKPVKDGGVVYSLAGRRKLGLEKKLAKVEGCEVHVFGGVPISTKRWGPSLQSHAWNLGVQDSDLDLSPSISNATIEVKSLSVTKEELGHKYVDVMVLDGLDVRKEMDESLWTEYVTVCQFVVRFSEQIEHANTQRWLRHFGDLGFSLITCKGAFGSEKCLFITRSGCVRSSSHDVQERSLSEKDHVILQM